MFVFMFLEFLKANALFCHNRENEIKQKCGNETFCSSFDPAGLEGLPKLETLVQIINSNIIWAIFLTRAWTKMTLGCFREIPQTF